MGDDERGGTAEDYGGVEGEDGWGEGGKPLKVIDLNVLDRPLCARNSNLVPIFFVMLSKEPA